MLVTGGIIDTGATSIMKSGKGTPMYSNRGKTTINEYLCFSKDPIEEEERKH